MNKQEIDQLYHLLRQASNISEDRKINTKTCLMPQEQINVIYGLCRHLLAGGDYSALVQFSQFYGESYLLGPTFREIKYKFGPTWQPRRVVEFGAGLGWLGRGLAAKFGMLPLLLVDKRPWPLINLVADLESQEDKEVVLHEMKEGDLIVACDFLHCLEDPYEVMAGFDKWPIAVLEYRPADVSYLESYSEQISRYGASPVTTAFVESTFPGRKRHLADIDPYALALIDPVTNP